MYINEVRVFQTVYLSRDIQLDLLWFLESSRKDISPGNSVVPGTGDGTFHV